MALLDYLIQMIILFGLIFSYFNILVLLKKESYIDNKKNDKNFIYPKVSIIVPAYNEEQNIRDAILSLINLDYPKDKLEIIVIDDGSEDKTFYIAKNIEKKFPNIVRVIRQDNKGKAAALNHGIKNSTGDVIVTLDADSIVPKDSLKKLIKILYRDHRTMIAIPAIQVKTRRTLVEKLQSIEYTYNNTLREIFRKLNALYVAPGPFSVFKKEFFKIAGYFDESNITEDMEIALRCHSLGYKVEYCKSVIVLTDAPKNIKSLIKQRVRWYMGFLYNYEKYKDKINNISLSTIVLPSAFSFIMASLLMVFLFFYININTLFNIIDYTISINFDILPEIHYAIREFDIGNVVHNILFSISINSHLVLFFSIIGMLIFTGMVYFSWKYEKRKDIVSLLIYQFIYLFVYVSYWVVTFYYKVFNKPIKWGRKYWINGRITEEI